MKQVLTAFAIFWGGLLMIVGLFYMGLIYYFFFKDHSPKNSNSAPISMSQPSSTAPPAPTATAPAIPPPAPLPSHTGTPEQKVAKAVRDLENGTFSDSPVADKPAPLPAFSQTTIGKHTAQNPPAACTTTLGWHIVAIKVDSATQTELQSYLGKLCLDFAPGSKHTLIGQSHWACCPSARTDGVVGMVQGDAILFDRQLHGGAQRYTGSVIKSSKQTLAQATLQGKWLGKNDSTPVQGTWVATPIAPQPAATN